MRRYGGRTLPFGVTRTPGSYYEHGDPHRPPPPLTTVLRSARGCRWASHRSPTASPVSSSSDPSSGNDRAERAAVRHDRRNPSYLTGSTEPLGRCRGPTVRDETSAQPSFGSVGARLGGVVPAQSLTGHRRRVLVSRCARRIRPRSRSDKGAHSPIVSPPSPVRSAAGDQRPFGGLLPRPDRQNVRYTPARGVAVRTGGKKRWGRQDRSSPWARSPLRPARTNLINVFTPVSVTIVEASCPSRLPAAAGPKPENGAGRRRQRAGGTARVLHSVTDGSTPDPPTGGDDPPFLETARSRRGDPLGTLRDGGCGRLVSRSKKVRRGQTGRQRTPQDGTESGDGAVSTRRVSKIRIHRP